MRHTRQSRLREVGAEGQARIAAAEVAVRGRDLGAQVAARYLAAAGVGRVIVEDESVAAFARGIDPAVKIDVGPGSVHAADTLGARDPVAASFAAGAHAALEALRGIV